MTPHILKKLDTDIASLRSRVQAMFALALQQLEDSVILFEKCHREKGLAVAELEPRLHELQFAIDRECANMIALRQPNAGDLRIAIASMRIASAIEAVGNAALEIAGAGERIHKSGRKPLSEPEALVGQYAAVQRMLVVARDACQGLDAGALSVIAAIRQEQSLESSALTERLGARLEAEAGRARVLAEEIEIARCLNRVAALALAIALQVYYMAKGEDRRHQPLEELLTESAGA
jgi:phosphate transport system protein